MKSVAAGPHACALFESKFEMNPETDRTSRDIKAAMRNGTLALRDRITAEQRLEKSLAIAACGAPAISVAPGEVVSGFFPIRSEPDIRPLMSHLAARGARLCLPVVIDRTTILFRALVPGAPLVDTGFGTCGPGPEAAVLEPDLMLVPLAAFDRAGHRIGYGAGHYDRAIARARAQGHPPRLIGIAFDCQEVPNVPFEPHDVPLEAVITESGWRQLGV
jgi:5-formyltetrahydrofolate cyclo-ligase